MQELRSKAKYFEWTGIIPTLDATASIAKSDTLVSTELHDSLRAAFDKLKADQASCPDWHPKSNGMVQDLVHPSMYPLVYGRSRGFQAECVGVTDAIKDWAGKGDLIPRVEHEPLPRGLRANFFSSITSGSKIPTKFWSDTYQWLPANVVFQEDGSVKFTSYINNLHPTKYPDIYRTIEKLVETSFPLWDQCLRNSEEYDERKGPGRLDTRSDKPKDPS